MSIFEVKRGIFAGRKAGKAPVRSHPLFPYYAGILGELFLQPEAMGFNTVETYIPWNIHEPEEGVFDFSGNKDVVRFVAWPSPWG